MRFMKMFRSVFFVSVFVWTLPTLPADAAVFSTGAYVVVPAKGRVAAFVRSTLHDFDALVPEYSGELFVAESSEGISPRIRLSFRTESITTHSFMRDSVMRTDVLEVSKYPSAEFRSMNVKRLGEKNGVLEFHVEGEFSFHGVKKNISVLARVHLAGDEVRAEILLPILLSDYKVKTPSPIPFIGVEDRVEIKGNFILRLKN